MTTMEGGACDPEFLQFLEFAPAYANFLRGVFLPSPGNPSAQVAGSSVSSGTDKGNLATNIFFPEPQKRTPPGLYEPSQERGDSAIFKTHGNLPGSPFSIDSTQGP